jgi:hypothetical protein
MSGVGESTYERAGWDEPTGVLGGEGDFSGGFNFLAGILITFLVLLNSRLDAILLS